MSISQGLIKSGSDAKRVASRPVATLIFFMSSRAASRPKRWGGGGALTLGFAGRRGGESAADEVQHELASDKISARIATTDGPPPLRCPLLPITLCRLEVGDT